jgi:hypothetical protein
MMRPVTRPASEFQLTWSCSLNLFGVICFDDLRMAVL